MAHINEAHLFNEENGHVLSVDCWCEPVSIRWYKNIHNVMVLVVEHEDFVPPIIHRYVMLEARDENPEDWITILLNQVKEPRYGTND